MNTETLMPAVPAIGAPYEGGIYAGISVHKNAPVHLVLLPDDWSGTWKTAGTKAAKLGGELPTRIDLLVMWNNVPSEFKKDWYWSGEEQASDAQYAWFQYFNVGNQSSTRKGSTLRGRAVRRLPL